MAQSPESFTFTVGKLDAGMAILLGERAHLIEFPSLLLPPGATTGSIVNIAVHRNLEEEKRRDQDFWDLQKNIFETFGVDTPQPPKLELRNVTQTSVTLEWPPLHLATAKLRSLDIYRNRQRLATIPQPLQNTSTKLSGLEINTEYTFQLVLRTTAGTHASNVIRVRTHTMTDTSGISVCFGTVQDKVLLENAKLALREMKAKWSDKIQIDTTHFVCTTPAATPAGAQVTGGLSSGPGVEYQRALQLSIPVVQPGWIMACYTEKKMVAIGPYYLGATSNSPISSAPFTRPQSMSQVSLQRSPTRPNADATSLSNKRQSMPAQRSPVTQTQQHAEANEAGDDSTFVNQTPPPSRAHETANGHAHSLHPMSEEDEGDDITETSSRTSALGPTRPRVGTMNKDFRFPSPSPNSPKQKVPDQPPPVPPVPSVSVSSPAEVTPPEPTPTHEVPPPPPVEKERERVQDEDHNEEVGETEEIDLN